MRRWIFRLRQRKIFFRLFIVYTTVLFALIVLSITLIGRIYLNALMDETDKTYLSALNNAKSESVSSIDNADRDAIQLLSNNAVISFFSDFYDNPTEKRISRYNAINELKNTRINSQVIDTLALYPLNKDYIITDTAGYTRQEYASVNSACEDIIKWAYDNGIKKFAGVIGGENKVYIIRAYPTNTTEKNITGYLLMELNKNYIYRLFREKLPDEAAGCILNNDGGIIAGNIGGDVNIKEFLTETENKAEKDIYIDGRSFAVFRDNAGIVPWEYVMLLDTETQNAVMRTLIITAILIGMCMFVFGAFVVYYASKLTCNPIDEFFERTAKRIHETGKSGGLSQGRYSYESIELIMNKILIEDQKMRDEIRETIPARKWNLMLKILSGEVEDFSEISAAAKLLEIKLYDGSYAVMIAELANNEDSDDFAICAPMICKRIESQDGCMAVVTLGNRIVAFMSSIMSGDELIGQIRSLTLKLSQTAEDMYEKRVIVGVSEVFCDLPGAKQAYEQALRCIDFEAAASSDGLILYRDILEYNEEEFFAVVKRASKISESIKNRDEAAAESFINNVFEIIKAKHFPKRQIRYIVDIIRYEILETTKSIVNMPQEDIRKICSEKTVYSGDINRIRAGVLTEVVSVIRYVKDKVDDMPSNTTIQRIVQYINENYRSSDMSITELSKIMNISSTYITNSFKKFEGMSFYEYLTQLRMNEAGRLLLQSGKKIYEVAEEVGYTSSQSFIRAFKKYYGVTPEKFRLNKSE